MKKTITRTTKEYTYSEEGFLLKEVETVEEYEVEVANGGLVKSGSVADDKTKIDSVTPYRKATGIPPYSARFSDEGKVGSLLVNGEEVKIPQDTINKIISQVKSKLDAEASRQVRLTPRKPY
jgi:hypothetical protein